jgi:TolB-like protein/Tfp pilus assembly protein PilF
VTDPRKAVFLSYSSQDAEAALRIRDALDAAGLEVWFDKSELRGGDAWDASIRKQIRECALFVPIISANTEARSEGYFRLEWKLAVDRSHLMADDTAFLLPVALDDTLEATARVPDRFRELQWSRLPAMADARAFAERALRLLAPRGGLSSAPPADARSAAASASDSPSIAVLPFVNMSRDEENEYFADGLSEELLNVLAKIRGLRVASRTSAFFFKGKNIDLPTVGQKLNVATILEGSVRKSGKRVRITAQLVEVASDSHLWSETYDRELDDIFAVQDDIARSVVTELRSALLGEGKSAPVNAVAAEVKAASSGRAENAEAQRIYLQGKFFLDRFTEDGVSRAIEHFHRALALDADFALAWAGLSRAYWSQAGYGWTPVAEGFEKARDAAKRAITIAPDLPDGHVCLGQVLASHDMNWKGAEAAYRRALALDPTNPSVLRAFGNQAGQLGRGEEALSYLRKAAELDPLNATGHRVLGLRCMMYGRLEEGEKWLRSSMDLNPGAGLVNCFLSVARLWQGKAEEALEIAEREVMPEFRLLGIFFAQHTLGRAEEATRTLEALIRDFAHVSAFQIAEAFAWRGDKERAFEWLERAYAQRDPGVGHALMDPFFAPLRDDPRWPPLLKKIGFD